MRPNLKNIIACPKCKSKLNVIDERAECKSCNLSYFKQNNCWNFMEIGLNNDEKPYSKIKMPISKLSGRVKKYSKSKISQLYEKLYIHPTVYFGDLQSTGIKNFHKKVKEFMDLFNKNSFIIDCGSGERRLSFDVLTLDIDPESLPDLIADAHYIPLIDECADGIILQEVLEHVNDPDLVLTEAFRILKPGGRIYCEVPFLYPVHDSFDYRRWTITGLELLCNRYEKVESGVCIGPFSTVSSICRRAITYRIKSFYLEAIIDLLLGWLLSPIKYLDLIFSQSDNNIILAGAVFYHGIKR